jgi:PrgI family protein
MATYKMIQDIEAEDHILGPLTLRQFIFALVAVFFLYICFICLTKGAAFLLVLFLPPALFFGFFAVPFGRDQPTEIWALAKIRFWIKPRKRLWNQSGIKELVTITAPRKIERTLTNGLSQPEVESRLKALANTIDSRGWVIKNVNINAYAQPNPLVAAPTDRLIDISNIPQEVPSYDVQASDDILDESSNPIARQFEDMINASSQTHRQQLVSQLNDARSDAAPAISQPAAAAQATMPDYWFMNPAGRSAGVGTQVVRPGGSSISQAAAPTNDDATTLASAHQAHDRAGLSNAHLRTLQPLGSNPAPVVPAPSVMPGSGTSDPAILSLANNNDLNVATLAREAHKAKGEESDEVVISLH